ncbi:hypothetical protein [Acidiphilium iwatense]|uniref:hypothetical protein n=1 Tax=Acidiphilium iwatense TaxID=768198 RepID=UPI001F339268|nr:hypothetical protein [Acidiphilium iwatense]
MGEMLHQDVMRHQLPRQLASIAVIVGIDEIERRRHFYRADLEIVAVADRRDNAIGRSPGDFVRQSIDKFLIIYEVSIRIDDTRLEIRVEEAERLDRYFTPDEWCAPPNGLQVTAAGDVDRGAIGHCQLPQQRVL